MNPILYGLLTIATLFQVSTSFQLRDLASITRASKANCNFIERYRDCSETYEPVCSSYPGICLSSSCQPQDFPNSCYACQDPTVSAYISGLCPSNSQSAISEVAEPGIPGTIGEETGEFGETEVSEEGGEGSEEGKGEETSEISETEVPESPESEEQEQPEEGEEQETPEEEQQEEEEEASEEEQGELPLRDSFYVVVFCDDPRPQQCFNDYNPVCVIGCKNGTCIKTFDNSCKACQDRNVLSYSLERCEKQKMYCNITSTATAENSCLSLFDPVCAYKKGCTGSNCGSTVTNACEACYVNKAEYFVLGPC